MPLDIETMKKAATHRSATGVFYQLSKPGDDFSGSAWWLNEASGTWQISPFSNEEVQHGNQFYVVA